MLYCIDQNSTGLLMLYCNGQNSILYPTSEAKTTNPSTLAPRTAICCAKVMYYATEGPAHRDYFDKSTIRFVHVVCLITGPSY